MIHSIEVFDNNRQSNNVAAIKLLRDMLGLQLGDAKKLFERFYCERQPLVLNFHSADQSHAYAEKLGEWGFHWRCLMPVEENPHSIAVPFAQGAIALNLPSPIALFDEAIRRDPAQRGLIGRETTFGPLCVGHLSSAATELATHASHLGIVTGFFIPRGEPPAAETDGPLGALLLAATLREAGIKTTVLSDAKCIAAIRATAAACDFPLGSVVEYPHGDAAWRAEFFQSGAGRDLSHLLAIERVGPSHTRESLEDQVRIGPPPLADYEAKVADEHRNHCHNMRGEIIDEFTADTYRLFEDLPRYRPAAKTIGIGDGANEIGMGKVPWEELERRLTGPQSGRVPCRIATDWNILAGTSNWGGYALAAATLLLRGQTEILRPWTCDQQFRVLEKLVFAGPAVDGVTRRQEATVDGLPFLTYIQPWAVIRQLLGLPE